MLHPTRWKQGEHQPAKYYTVESRSKKKKDGPKLATRVNQAVRRAAGLKIREVELAVSTFNVRALAVNRKNDFGHADERSVGNASMVLLG